MARGKALNRNHVWVGGTSSQQPAPQHRLCPGQSHQTSISAQQLSRNSHSNTQIPQSASARDFTSQDLICHPTGRDTGMPMGAGVSTQCKWGGKAAPSPTAQHHPLEPPTLYPHLGWLRPNDERSDPTYCKTQPAHSHKLCVRARNLLYCMQDL